MLKTGSLGISYLYNLLKSDSGSSGSSSDTLEKNTKNLRAIRSTLESHGGVFAKISQIISYDNSSSSVFSECKPYSQKKTIKYIKKIAKERYSEKDFSIDFNVYKSGSIGQVHIGTFNQKKVAIKVQYTDLVAKTEDDLKAFDLLASFMYVFTDVKQIIKDIRQKMHEELDYTIELANHTYIYNLWKDTNISIPNVYPELSTDKIIVTDFIEGDNLTTFIKTADQESKNKIAYDIIKFTFENLYKHHVFYSDMHFGNIIIQDGNKLGVIDFGCLHYLKNTMCNHLINIHKAIIENNDEKMFVILKDFGILTDSVSELSRNYCIKYFKLQYEPWFKDSFEFTAEWWETINQKDTDLLAEWKLPAEVIYLNKVPYCLYQILVEMKASGNFKQIFTQIFEDIENSENSLESELEKMIF